MVRIKDEKTLAGVGYIVSFVGFIMYLVCLIFQDAVTEKYSDPLVSLAYQVLCIVNFALLISSVILAIGIIKRDAHFLKTWLITVAVSVFLGMLSIIKCAGHGEIVVPSVVLTLTGIAWFPMYCLYRIYCSERRQPPHGREMLALGSMERGIDVSATPITPYTISTGMDNSPDYAVNPPSYDTVVASISPYPTASTSMGPPVGWRS